MVRDFTYGEQNCIYVRYATSHLPVLSLTWSDSFFFFYEIISLPAGTVTCRPNEAIFQINIANIHIGITFAGPRPKS